MKTYFLSFESVDVGLRIVEKLLDPSKGNKRPEEVRRVLAQEDVLCSSNLELLHDWLEEPADKVSESPDVFF
jgi:hypothetical protein